MVCWYLIEANDEHVVYEYYPEDHKDKKAGIITIDRITERTELTQPAEEDFERYEKEFNERWYYYYDHAKCGIVEDYNNGIINEKGIAAWY